MERILILVGVAPLLVAAFAPEQQGLSLPTLLLVCVAIVGVVVLRGVLLRRHLRKRRPVRRRGDDFASTDPPTTTAVAGTAGRIATDPQYFCALLRVTCIFRPRR